MNRNIKDAYQYLLRKEVCSTSVKIEYRTFALVYANILSSFHLITTTCTMYINDKLICNWVCNGSDTGLGNYCEYWCGPE